MNPIVSEEYYDLLIDNSITDLYLGTSGIDKIYQINPKHSIVLVPANQFSMCEIGVYAYAFFPSLFTLNESAISGSNIDKIQLNPNFALFGQGVLVAVIDTGIDYLHQAFRFPDGSTRIHSIWDQTINNSTPNAIIQYGTLYTREIIDSALINSSPLSIVPTVDDNGHGTMIAGIIGGSENKSAQFASVVPQCEFIIVKLKPAKKLNKEIFCIPEDKICYQESDIVSALTYVFNTSYALNRPLSICLALGTSQGGHSGKGATSGYLDFITQTPRIGVSVAGGNEGSNRRHVYANIVNPFFTDIELNVSEKDTSFSMEIWGNSPYRLSVDIISPTDETVRNIYPRLRECRKLDFIFTPCVVYVNNIITESGTGDQLILIRFQKSFSGLWRFRQYSIDEKDMALNAWLPSSDLISDDTYFLNSTSDTTITTPGNSESPMTVSNYSLDSGSIAINSSRGYTRYNLIKPELAAPGQNIRCPIPNNGYSFISGTGASAAHSTGIMAMLLEWAVVRGNYTGITGLEMNKMLIRGATRLAELEYPNRSWGYGAMDIFGVFEKLI